LKTLHSTEREILYDGKQLSPHWVYKTFDISGDALVSFIGPCDVTLDQMVDLEDVKNKSPIGSSKMLHFLGEWFMDSLNEGILLQHLLICEIYELMLEKEIPSLHRRGNDIYYQSRKMSVSIATRSSVSVLIHVGINIENSKTPIPTACLDELQLEPSAFANQALNRFFNDYSIWRLARTKVIPR